MIVPCSRVLDRSDFQDGGQFRFNPEWHSEPSRAAIGCPECSEVARRLIKNIAKKAKKDGSDKWKAILEWRNAPTLNSSSSPAQRLMSRRTRSFLPVFRNAISTLYTR